MNSARDTEQAMLERCRQIATTPDDVPRNQAEANVCRLAGMIVRIRYPEAGARLFDAATTYFAEHPEASAGWIGCSHGFVSVSASLENGGLLDSCRKGRFCLSKVLPGC